MSTSSLTAPSLVDLRDELRAAGLGKPAAVATYAKFFLLATAALSGLAWVALNLDAPIYILIPLALLSSWLLTGAAMCGHDGAHAATSHTPWVNTLLAQMGFTLLGGLSITYWRHKHNSLHHPNVNVGTKDPDVQQGLLALSVAQHESHGDFIRFLQRHFQAPVFWLVGAPLVLFDLKITSIHYVIKQLIAGGNRTAYLGDLAWLVAHYLLWVGLPLLFLPVSTALICFAVSSAWSGVYLAAIFAPAHVPYPVVKDFHDPLLLQLTSTRNLKTNWFFRFTLIGLDQQIEHHLAPTLPHFDLPRARVIVRSYCERHGLPYHETSWLRALLDTTVAVRDGWRINEVVVGEPASLA
ncbi:MAG: fatty acid desaturase [Planctomycetota bacterium]